jgi:hypothetical protein
MGLASRLADTVACLLGSHEVCRFGTAGTRAEASHVICDSPVYHTSSSSFVPIQPEALLTNLCTME